MKNIHLIATDNYAPLVHSTGRYGGYFKSEHYSPMKDMGDSYQHIYITSNEEIKEGDWFVDTIGSEILKADSIPLPYSCKKIILTTDKDLIADGVQAIDDEFLQWFVKNPSCEEVETKLVEFEVDMELGDSCIEYGSYYEIIIPKQETTAYHYLSCCRSIEECHCGKYPKQFKCDCSHTTTCDCSPIEEQKDVVLGYKTSLDAQMLDKVESKQQTLEKAAHKMLMDYGIMSVGESINVLNVKKLMVLFAKWQQEQDKNKYSEEDMKQAYLDGCKIKLTNIYHLEKWFEQFKKK